ncbi:aminotransferase class IV [Puniceicoccaceae bacterium K14]|nr:aminotransferase class IV [Puniceicoccaceae bacterium K14]
MNEVGSQISEDYIQGNFNGKLCDARAPMISPLDRGFLYGDAIYEVWRTYEGVIFGWHEHWERLLQTAEGLSMELPLSQEDVLDLIRFTTKAWRDKTGSDSELYVRLQISRGAGLLGLDTGLADTANFAIFVKAQGDLSDEKLDKGLSLHVSENWKRNPLDAMPPSLKTGNYLNNILGLSEAKKHGCDDVLFLNHAGDFTEASTRNVWFIFDDRISTPRIEDGILAGVTRRLILENIDELGSRPFVEEKIRPEDLASVEECFLTSSTQDVQPVSSIGELTFKTGSETLTRALKSEFNELVKWTVEVKRNSQWV